MTEIMKPKKTPAAMTMGIVRRYTIHAGIKRDETGEKPDILRSFLDQK